MGYSNRMGTGISLVKSSKGIIDSSIITENYRALDVDSSDSKIRIFSIVDYIM